MTASIRIAPPNSVLLIEDSDGGDIPVSMNGSLFAATASCIAVGCRAEDDGETEVAIGPCGDVDPGDRPAFEGSLLTPNRLIAVRTVYGVTVLEMPVAAVETVVRIWVNGASDPDRVAIGIV